MKTWEKIAQLDQQYVEARKQIMLNRDVTVEVIVHNAQPKQTAALITPKKNATKSSTATSSPE